MVELIESQLSSYFLIGSIGFVLGAVVMIHNVARNGVPFQCAVLAVTACIYGGLIGTRLLFVALNNPTLFVENLPLAIAFWQGGLSWLGGPILGGAVFLAVMKMAGQPGWANVGSAVPGLALAHSVSRSSCLVRGCCYGAPTELPWAIFSDYLHTTVHPTQIYSMMSEACVAVLLQWLWWKRPPARKYLMPLYGVLLASHRFVTESFRGEPPGPEWISGLRFYQSLCVIVFALSLAILALLWRRRVGLVVSTGVAITTAGVFIVLQPSTANTFSPMQSVLKDESALVFLVATRSMFVEALTPWSAHRENDGFTVVVRSWDSPPSEAAIQEWIGEHATEQIRFCLIVGDSGGPGETEHPWHMPSARKQVSMGDVGEPYTYDAPFGDLDHDGRPDYPVGRLPVRTTAELTQQIQNIIESDSRQVGHTWHRAIIWTGASEFGGAMGKVTDGLTKRVPDWLAVHRVSGADGNGTGDRREPETFLQEITQPSIVSLIASHGQMDTLWTEHTPEGRLVLSTEAVRDMTSHTTLGPLFILACNAGEFDRPLVEGISIAEAFFGHKHGPVAVVAASSSMHPLTNFYVTREMVEALAEPPQRIGEYLTRVQQRLIESGDKSFADRVAGDELARHLFEPLSDLQASNAPRVLKHEGLMYNLLGDPATRLHIPPIQED